MSAQKTTSCMVSSLSKEQTLRLQILAKFFKTATQACHVYTTQVERTCQHRYTQFKTTSTVHCACQPCILPAKIEQEIDQYDPHRTRLIIEGDAPYGVDTQQNAYANKIHIIIKSREMSYLSFGILVNFQYQIIAIGRHKYSPYSPNFD